MSVLYTASIFGFLHIEHNIGICYNKQETLAAFAEVDEMKRTGAGEHFSGSTEDLFNMILEG